MQRPPDRSSSDRADVERIASAKISTALEQTAVCAPTMAVAVFDRNGVVEFGSRSSVPNVPSPGRNDVFRIASMSKSFLVAVTLSFVERGLIDLNAAVTRYVPEFSGGTADAVTVQMLMSNCTGLPEDNAWTDHHLGISKHVFRDLVIRGLRFTEMPGTTYQYANLNFALLSMVVENVTGQDYSEVLSAEVLLPLALRRTRYSADDYSPSDVLARGFSSFDDGRTWNERGYVGSGALAPVGSLFSTVEDIATWASWLNGPFDPEADSDDSSVLTSEFRMTMQKIHTVIPSIQPRMAKTHLDAIGYGFGLIVEQDTRFGSIAQHSGGLPGFSTNMRWHLDSGIGVVAYATTEGQDMAGFTSDLLRELLLDLGTPARRVRLWPETIHAATQIDRMLLDGADFEQVSALLSPNVFSDIPSDVRTNRARRLCSEVGGLADAEALQERILWCASAAHLVWRLPGNSGDLLVGVELAEIADTPVQRITVEAEEAGSSPDEAGTPFVINHQVPLWR